MNVQRVTFVLPIRRFINVLNYTGSGISSKLLRKLRFSDLWIFAGNFLYHLLKSIRFVSFPSLTRKILERGLFALLGLQARDSQRTVFG